MIKIKQNVDIYVTNCYNVNTIYNFGVIYLPFSVYTIYEKYFKGMFADTRSSYGRLDLCRLQ